MMHCILGTWGCCKCHVAVVLCAIQLPRPSYVCPGPSETCLVTLPGLRTLLEEGPFQSISPSVLELNTGLTLNYSPSPALTLFYLGTGDCIPDCACQVGIHVAELNLWPCFIFL